LVSRSNDWKFKPPAPQVVVFSGFVTNWEMVIKLSPKAFLFSRSFGAKIPLSMKTKHSSYLLAAAPFIFSSAWAGGIAPDGRCSGWGLLHAFLPGRSPVDNFRRQHLKSIARVPDELPPALT
jgi:hypothetical protein